jgi:hypothetical protein
VPTKDPRIDVYIANSAEFARPILTHLRKLIHTACPEVVETIKWNNPAFEHKGLLCGVAAFKHYCGFGFWKQDLLFPEKGRSMREFGRFATLADLPKDSVFLGYIRKAVALNEAGNQSARAQIETQTPGRRARLFSHGAQEKQKSAGHVRGVQPQPQTRIRGVASRSQTRRDPRQTTQDRRRMAGPRQIAELEI